jgi:hypothetical protein
MIEKLIGILLLLAVLYPLYPAYKGFRNNRRYNYKGVETDDFDMDTRVENAVISYMESFLVSAFAVLFASLVVGVFSFSFIAFFGL